ncbi:coagulation factor IX [Xyrichtys novacula]|nr:coagulation factor IX [Xyrichtys novacula]
MDRGDFLCLCPPQYHGKICDAVVFECRYRNGACMQYCRDLPGSAGVQCGCALGFKLEPDGRSCSKTVLFPCGQQHSELMVGGRSLWSHSETVNVSMEMDAMLEENSTNSGVPKVNLTETKELLTVNASSALRGGNKGVNMTELWEDEREGEEGVMTRIVGGVLERPGGSPWQVLLHRADGYGFCGGTLVSDHWVISAAHCMEQPVDHVTIGDHDKRRPDPGEQLIKVQKVFVHPHFHSFTFDSDIALLYLEQPVVRGPTAVPACLPDRHLSKYLLQVDNRGVVTGWGLTRYLGRSSRFLRKVTLPVVSYSDCTATTEQLALKLDSDLDGNPPSHSSAPPPYNSATPNERREADSIMPQLQASSETARPKMLSPTQDSTANPLLQLHTHYVNPIQTQPSTCLWLKYLDHKAQLWFFTHGLLRTSQSLHNICPTPWHRVQFFAEQFLTFCQELKPTMNELKRLTHSPQTGKE